MLRFSTTLLLLGALCLTGCQQPTAGGGRQPVVDLNQRPRLFNWGGQPAYRAAAADARYEQTRANGGWGWGSNYANNDPNNLQIQTNSPQQYEQFANLSQQVTSLNNRLSRFDSDNQQLVTELATMKQKLQVANDYNYQLKQQLADNSSQLQQLNMQKSAAEQQLANASFQMEQLAQNRGQLEQQLQQQVQAQQVSTGGSRMASATLRANNSLMQKLPQIQIPGANARMDGDVIRVEIPTDQLFHQGSYNINAAHGHLLQNLATSINQNFSRQIIGIEAHWDGTQIQAPTTHHQLTASQSLAVVDYLTKLGLPSRQLFGMAMGSNRPRHPQNINPGGVSPNRRIEVVIYPETYDGS